MVTLIHLLAALIGALAGVLAALPLWRAGARGPALALSGLMAAGCVLLYAAVGTPAALRPPPVTGQLQDLQDLQASTDQLRQAIAADPGQLEGWVLLARTEALLGNHAAADAAWRRALELAPDQAGLLVEAAQARADADPQRRIDDQALAWLQQARAAEPTAQRALWLLGIAQRQRGDAAAAAATWESLLGLLDAGTAGAVREQIDKARAEAGLPALPADATPVPGGLQLRVALEPSLAARIGLDPDTPVFVQARASDGSPMPVAARRLRLADLPASVTLTDADSPMPTRLLSQLDQVVVSARISTSGSVQRSEGDVESAARAVTLPHAGIVELILQR